MQQPARRSYLPSTIKPLHLKPRVKTRDDVVWVVFLCCGKGLWRGVGEPALRDLYNALASSSLRHHLFREKRSARLRVPSHHIGWDLGPYLSFRIAAVRYTGGGDGGGGDGGGGAGDGDGDGEGGGGDGGGGDIGTLGS